MAVALHRIKKVLGDDIELWAFADDIAVWVRDPSQLAHIIATIQDILRQFDLYLNMSKCKLIGVEEEIPEEFHSWIVPHYKYLGINIPINRTWSCKRTLSAATKTANVLRARRIPVHIAAQVFNTYIWSKFVYQGAVYPISERTLTQVDDIVRSILGIQTARAYLGREIKALCDEQSIGGLGLIDYRTHAECMIGTLAMHVTEAMYWPKDYWNVLEALLEQRMQYVNNTIKQYLADSDNTNVTVKQLRKICPTVRVQRHAELVWRDAWPQIIQLDSERATSV